MADISNWLLNYSSYGLGWVASVSVLVRFESWKESQKGKKKMFFFFQFWQRTQTEMIAMRMPMRRLALVMDYRYLE